MPVRRLVSDRARELFTDAKQRAKRRETAGYYRAYWMVAERMHPEWRSEKDAFLRLVESGR